MAINQCIAEMKDAISVGESTSLSEQISVRESLIRQHSEHMERVSAENKALNIETSRIRVNTPNPQLAQDRTSRLSEQISQNNKLIESLNSSVQTHSAWLDKMNNLKSSIENMPHQECQKQLAEARENIASLKNGMQHFVDMNSSNALSAIAENQAYALMDNFYDNVYRSQLLSDRIKSLELEGPTVTAPSNSTSTKGTNHMEQKNQTDFVHSRVSELQNLFSEKNVENIMDMANDAVATKKPDYLDLKSSLKALSEEREVLKAALEKELSIAAANGMSSEVGNRIVALQKEIEENSRKAELNANNLDKIKDNVKGKMFERLQNVREKVSAALDKVKNGLLDKVTSGVAATGALAGRVRDANHRAFEVVNVSKDTAYTNLSEKVEQVARNWYSYNYTADRDIKNVVDKIKNTLEKSYEKKANIKEAFKDLGRSLIGKERQNNAGELSKIQSGILSTLTSLSNDIQKEMDAYEKKFNLSKELSLRNISSAMELRDGANMKESNSLNKRFEQAKEESISSRKSPFDDLKKEVEKMAGRER